LDLKGYVGMNDFVNSTIMRKWSCDTVPHTQLPRDVVDFCRRIQAEVIRVPVRLSGLTSSGKIGECYLNVSIATKLFGGSGVVGWVLVRDSDEALRNQSAFSAVLLGHAIWLNNESRASCVTGKSWGKHNGVYQKDGKTYFDFVLWGVNQKSCPTFLNDLWFKTDFFGCGCRISWTKDSQQESIRLDELNREKASKRLLSTSTNTMWEIVEERVLRERGVVRGTRELIKHYEELGGGFSEKSVATGKSYDQIKRERIKRLAS
jgi:hypothetical protein